MASTITVRETLRKVSVLLQDIDPQFVAYPETELVDFLGDAERAVFKFLPASCARLDAFKLAPGTLQSIESIAPGRVKPGDGSTATANVIGALVLDVLCNMGSSGTVAGRAIRNVTDGREELDAIDPDWQTKTAPVATGFIFDPRFPRHFHILPGNLGGVDQWVRLGYIAEPLKIPNTGTPGAELYAASGANALVLSVHDEHNDDLVNYVCARALMKHAQSGVSTGMSAHDFASLFTGAINAKSQVIMGYNPNLKRLPFAPEPIGAAS